MPRYWCCGQRNNCDHPPRFLLTKDEVCIEVGADPATAANLMQRMASNALVAPQNQAPPCPTPVGAGGDNEDGEGTPKDTPKDPDTKKKPKPKSKKPKPAVARRQFYFV